MSQAIFDQAKDLLLHISNTTIHDAEGLESFRISYLGSKNMLKDLFAQMKDIEPSRKKEFGQLMNSLKQAAENHYILHLNLKVNTAIRNDNITDWTLPSLPCALGSMHPLSIVRNDMEAIFTRLGFSISEGPEIEDDWHNFGALNLDENHPARDMQDTFYIKTKPDVLLRTHTSSVQVRVMESTPPPIRSIFPGRVYRNETISARAHCFFHQIEGLYIDKEVSFADLKQTLYYFVKELFGEVAVRFRPSYFPFTEPSAEMDISCLICRGIGCSICKQSGWVEILGCGMVDPAVLDNCGIDHEIYSGFAFGIGIERAAMLRYQINDLRLFSENDLRFLKQFTGI